MISSTVAHAQFWHKLYIFQIVEFKKKKKNFMSIFLEFNQNVIKVTKLELMPCPTK